MCWKNYIVTPIVLKKPLRVYKVGTSTILGSFRSLYHNFVYRRSKVMPTVEINPELTQYNTFSPLDKCWTRSTFCINEGYHSYLTKEIAKYNSYEYEDIGVFEIPAGATVCVNYRHKEVVSTNIKYLGLLEE
mgnify:CR=1 FL=1